MQQAAYWRRSRAEPGNFASLEISVPNYLAAVWVQAVTIQEAVFYCLGRKLEFSGVRGAHGIKKLASS